MVRKARLVCWALFLLTSFSAKARAGGQNVPIKVLVRDSSGAVIPNAIVKVSAAEASLTDANGATFLHVSPGEYDLVAISPGFANSRKHVSVSAADGQAVDFSLQPYSGSGPVVVDSGISIFTTNPTVSSLVYQEGFLNIQTPDGRLEVVGANHLAALPHKTVTFHNVHTKADEAYSGVSLNDLLAKYGAPTGDKLRGKGLSDYIVATGADGYKAVLSLAETDPSFHPGEVIVADSMDGKPLDAKEGPFKLVVTEDKRPARCVHNLVSLELETAE